MSSHLTQETAAPKWREATYNDLNGQEQIVELCIGETSANGAIRNQTPIILMSGVGKTRASIEATVTGLPQFRLVGVNLDFPDKTPEGIEQTIQAGTSAVAQNVQGHMRWDGPLDMAGDSMGGGIALKAAHDNPNFFDRLVLNAPLGLNREAFHPAEAEHKPALMVVKRMGANQRAIKAEDPDNYVDSDSLSQAEKLEATAYLRTLSEYGLAQDGVPLLKGLVELDHDVYVFASPDDPVFPYREIAESLSAQGLEHVLRQSEGRHYASGTVGNISQLSRALSSLQTGRRRQPQSDKAVIST